MNIIADIGLIGKHLIDFGLMYFIMSELVSAQKLKNAQRDSVYAAQHFTKASKTILRCFQIDEAKY